MVERDQLRLFHERAQLGVDVREQFLVALAQRALFERTQRRQIGRQQLQNREIALLYLLGRGAREILWMRASSRSAPTRAVASLNTRASAEST